MTVNFNFGVPYKPQTVIALTLATPTQPAGLHVEGNLIKDSLGNTVVLRGVNINEMADDPDGTWQGNDLWNDANVQTELTGVANIGAKANTIRCFQAIEDWVNNIGPNSGQPSSSHCSIPNRDAVNRLMNFAAQHNLYVIYVPYHIRDYYSGGTQDPLPYPPYATSPNASQVIANAQAFVDYWANVASTLKNHPNAIFELYNEAGADEASWFSVAQQCITAIRNTGATNLIIFQWQPSVYCNITSQTGDSMQWVFDHPLNDPTGNLVYSTHVYRQWGAFQLWNGGVQTYAYTLADITNAFQFFKIPQVAALHPVIIGEIGCKEGLSGTEQQNEYTAYTNFLNLCNQNGVGYCGYVWRANIEFQLISNWSPTLTNGGQLLKTAISNG